MDSLFSKFRYRLRTSRIVQASVIILFLLFLLGSFGLFQAMTDPYACRIIDGVTIDGVEIGGMTKGQARKALKAAAEETILSQPLTLVLPKETMTIDPIEMKLKLDVRQAVKDAWSLGREDDSEAARNCGLSAYLSCDENTLFEKLLAYADQYDTALTQYQYRLEGTIPDLTEEGFDPAAACPSLVLTLGTPENHLDIADVQLQIMMFWSHGISSGKAGTYTLTIDPVPEQLPEEPDLTVLYEEFSVEAADAFADLEAYRIIPASYGLIFNMEAAQAAVTNASWGETVTIPMTFQSPKILSEAVPFRDVLGRCDTKHNDDENRNTNLRLVCEILDGHILQPGEEFSYNGVIGERTPERGFKPATAYSGTRVIKDYGGGVCQGSSTLYNCVLLADLEVTERVCHGFTVGYLPIGLDAAVNWATKTDFKFRNNFHFPVQIKAEVSDGYMKMQIVGIDEKDYYIEMRSGRSDEEHRIYSNSYKYKYDKETGELISKDLEARSSYMYMSG